MSDKINETPNSDAGSKDEKILSKPINMFILGVWICINTLIALADGMIGKNKIIILLSLYKILINLL